MNSALVEAAECEKRTKAERHAIVTKLPKITRHANPRIQDMDGQQVEEAISNLHLQIASGKSCTGNERETLASLYLRKEFLRSCSKLFHALETAPC